MLNIELKGWISIHLCQKGCVGQILCLKQLYTCGFLWMGISIYIVHVDTEERIDFWFVHFVMIYPHYLFMFIWISSLVCMLIVLNQFLKTNQFLKLILELLDWFGTISIKSVFGSRTHTEIYISFSRRNNRSTNLYEVYIDSKIFTSKWKILKSWAIMCTNHDEVHKSKVHPSLWNMQCSYLFYMRQPCSTLRTCVKDRFGIYFQNPKISFGINH